MKAVLKKTLIVILLIVTLMLQTACISPESFDAVLYYTRLYALAHGNVKPNGDVDARGLVDDVWFDQREDTAYERAVRVVPLVPSLLELHN